MTRALSRRCSAAAVFALMVCVAPPASADVFDLQFERLVLPPPMGMTARPDSDDNKSAGALIAYRQVVSELSAAMAPKILTTADTIGYSGFQFAIDYSFTTISNQACGGPNPSQTKGECPFYYAVEGSGSAGGARSIPGMVHTVSVLARKGIWLPLPSFEIGAGATKVMQSSLLAVQVYAKFALHEGFHGWPVPSLAIRGSGMRVLGEQQIDLTMTQIDVSISKSFGIAGTVTLVPYAGGAWLYVLPRGQVIDLTPNVDSYREGPGSLDLNNNAVFPSSANANITRWRFFGGLRLNYNVLVLTADFMATMCGDWNGHCDGTQHKGIEVPDNAATQYTFSLSGGFLF